jgi:alpha,alpha-trehalose-phosphate synthase [UDP-forming]
MSPNKRLIVVSNRLPISLERTGNSYAVKPSSGGLVTALRSVFRKYEGCWIGWTGTDYAIEVEEVLRSVPELEFQVHPVFLTEEERSGFYAGFSNEIMWPLFHDLQSRCNFDPSYWEAYVAINRRFADTVAGIARDDDFIWVHDYHLTRVAASLRQIGVRSSLAYFQHIPFPSPDIFGKLPWRTQLLTSILDFGLVGFQTARDRQNFAICVRRFVPDATIVNLGKQLLIERSGSHTRVGDFPISIDFDEFANQANTPEVAALAEQLHQHMPGCALILGVDRLDYTKGLPEKLKAFAEMLLRCPELRRKVTLLQVVVPSREDIPKYHDLKREIERRISEINGRFTEPGWVPIHFIYRRIEREQLLAYYRAADVALVTPLKDGMNLVAKEYCASQVDANGVLVLSEFAGAADQLQGGALLVNPNDVIGTAAALRHAIFMPREERAHRMGILRRSVKRGDVYRWTETFLRAAGARMDSDASQGLSTALPMEGLREAAEQPGEETVPRRIAEVTKFPVSADSASHTTVATKSFAAPLLLWRAPRR